MLIPARTDTKYWHDYIFSNSKIEVQFVRGRLYFEKNGVKSDSAHWLYLKNLKGGMHVKVSIWKMIEKC